MLNFPNVSVLGLSQDARFFEAGFQYASFRRLSVAGTINDLAEDWGVTGVWSGQEGVLTTIANNSNYEGLSLNGVNFGSGRIENLSFEPGLDVKTKGYTANLVVYDSGNLFNFTGLYYSGIDTSNFPNLNEFSESYSFDKKLNGGYSYSHNANIQFISGAQNLFAIGAAQSLARTLFTGSNLGFAFYPGFTNKQGKRYITETYDLINGTCGFQETFDFDNNLGAYSAIYTNSVQLDEQGIATATENGSIRGIENPNYQVALTAIATEMTGSYYRCSGVVTQYFPTGAILITTPLSQGRTIDIFNNNIGYSVVFNNSPTDQTNYFWDYTLQATKQDGVSTVTENGSIVGRGENPTISFNRAQNGWNEVKSGIGARTTALFVTPYTPSTNYLEQKQESFSPYQGQVGYSYQYSNDPTLISNSGIRRVDVSDEENSPVYAYNKLDIFNVAEIAQDDKQSTQGSQTTVVNMEGDKTIDLPAYLAKAITEINTRIPAGNDRYVGGSSYSFAPNEGSANVQLTWLFNRSATKTIVP